MPQSHLARVLLALRANHEWETIVLPKSRLDPLVAVLPLGLRPSQPDQLERIGSFKDGGYLIDPRDIARADGLISLGIDRDWSFERQFRRRNPVPVHAYDGCTDTGYLLSDFARALRDLNWRWAVRSILRTMDYWWFFSGPSVRHYRRFVGTDQFAYEKTAATTIPLQQVFDGIRDAGSLKPFVKIDRSRSLFVVLPPIGAWVPTLRLLLLHWAMRCPSLRHAIAPTWPLARWALLRPRIFRISQSLLWARQQRSTRSSEQRWVSPIKTLGFGLPVTDFSSIRALPRSDTYGAADPHYPAS